MGQRIRDYQKEIEALRARVAELEKNLEERRQGEYTACNNAEHFRQKWTDADSRVAELEGKVTEAEAWAMEQQERAQKAEAFSAKAREPLAYLIALYDKIRTSRADTITLTAEELYPMARNAEDAFSVSPPVPDLEAARELCLAIVEADSSGFHVGKYRTGAGNWPDLARRVLDSLEGKK